MKSVLQNTCSYFMKVQSTCWYCLCILKIELFVMARSIQLGLLRPLKQVGSLTIFVAFMHSFEREIVKDGKLISI